MFGSKMDFHCAPCLHFRNSALNWHLQKTQKNDIFSPLTPNKTSHCGNFINLIHEIRDWHVGTTFIFNKELRICYQFCAKSDTTFVILCSQVLMYWVCVSCSCSFLQKSSHFGRLCYDLNFDARNVQIHNKAQWNVVIHTHN